MSAAEVIGQINQLPREERLKVIEYARGIDVQRLTAEELADLGEQMALANDVGDAERVQVLTEKFIRGFYGTEPHA